MSLDPKSSALASAAEYRQKFELEAAALYASVEGLTSNRVGQEESDDSDSEAEGSDDSVG